jgi:hypothetical protein
MSGLSPNVPRFGSDRVGLDLVSIVSWTLYRHAFAPLYMMSMELFRPSLLGNVVAIYLHWTQLSSYSCKTGSQYIYEQTMLLKTRIWPPSKFSGSP